MRGPVKAINSPFIIFSSTRKGKKKRGEKKEGGKGERKQGRNSTQLTSCFFWHLEKGWGEGRVGTGRAVAPPVTRQMFSTTFLT